MTVVFTHSRSKAGGYEVGIDGDTRFSSRVACLMDGRTIEQAFQLDIKGYRAITSDYRVGIGKPPMGQYNRFHLYDAYLALWQQWALENPELIEDLRVKVIACNGFLTDKFSKSQVSPAKALAHILKMSSAKEIHG